MRNRIITALLLGTLVAACLYFGGWVMVVLLFVLAVVMSLEWVALLKLPHPREMGFALGGGIGGLIALSYVSDIVLVMFLLVVSAIILAIMELIWRRSIILASGVLYTGLPCIIALWLRHSEPHGLWIIYYVVMSVVAIDIAALIFGKTIGGKKLVPRLSPQKTWAGLWGGIVGAMLFSIVFFAIMWLAGLRHYSAWMIIFVLPTALTLIAQAGDLFESALKRYHKVKDSGWLLPGHGGILDRVDGLAVVLMAVGLLAMIRGAIDHIPPALAIWGL